MTQVQTMGVGGALLQGLEHQQLLQDLRLARLPNLPGQEHLVHHRVHLEEREVRGGERGQRGRERSEGGGERGRER